MNDPLNNKLTNLYVGAKCYVFKHLSFIDSILIHLLPGKNVYLLSGEKVNWYEARRRCKSMNSELASIGSENENKEIKESINSISKYWLKDKMDGENGCKTLSAMTPRKVTANQSCSQSINVVCKVQGRSLCSMSTIPGCLQPMR